MILPFFGGKMLKVKDDGITTQFHLSNDRLSYVIEIIDNQFVVNRYFGPKIPFFAGSTHLDKGHHAFAVYENNNDYSASNLPLEYSLAQNGDYRQTSASITDKKNEPISFPKYISYDQDDDLVALKQMPHLRSKKGTALNIHLEDKKTGLEVVLHYYLLDDHPVLARWISYQNKGHSILHLQKTDSLQLDIPENRKWKTLSFYGTHANEFIPSIKSIFAGIQTISSNRGSSSPQHQPFLSLISDDFGLKHGSYVACHLIWSGNFQISVEQDQSSFLRLNAGINTQDFIYSLKPSECFNTPQALLTYGNNGLAGLSKNFQSLFKENIIDSRISEPLIALNTWEMAYFNVNEEKCLTAIDKAKEIGANLLVIDDGWFKNRNSENGQLGDWKTDLNKFPRGLKYISAKAHEKQLKFGLWVEPEMITTSSQLFKQHPDWVLGLAKNRTTLYSRGQLVLDLSKRVVQEHLINVLSELIKENNIDYLKWDFNRQLAPTFSQGRVGSEQGKTSYRYVMGLYTILANLRKKFKKLIIENCASGGGRMDGGMLYYTDQTWISDLTDSIGRFRILSNMATIYPIEVFSSHFSKSPNDQDGRIIPTQTRLSLSSIGSLGFELDLDSLDAHEISKIKTFIDQYKENYSLLHDGIYLPLTKLRTKETDPIGCLLTNNQDAIVIYSYGATNAIHQPKYLPLNYLSEDNKYKVDNDEQASGQELNFAGITIDPKMGDFQVEEKFIKQI